MSNKKLPVANVSALVATPPNSRKRAVSRPSVLGGAALPKLVLPPDFDLSVHRRIAETGIANPISAEELADLIATVKGKLPK